VSAFTTFECAGENAPEAYGGQGLTEIEETGSLWDVARKRAVA